MVSSVAIVVAVRPTARYAADGHARSAVGIVVAIAGCAVGSGDLRQAVRIVERVAPCARHIRHARFASGHIVGIANAGSRA